MTAAAVGALLPLVEAAVARVVEEEAERAARMAEETTEGRSWVGASRALFEHEVRAGVRFADLAADHDRNAAEVEGEVTMLHVAVVDVLLAAVFDSEGAARSVEAVSERLRAVRRVWPPALVRVVEDAAEGLASVFRRAGDRGARAAAEEAVRQGLAAEAVVGAIGVHRAGEAARQVADSLVDRLLLSGSSVVDTMRAAPDDLAAAEDLLRDAFENTSVKQVVDDARQVTHHAYGEGRVATVERLPEPSGVYASELLDRNTCTPCSHVDGKDYGSVAEAMEDYPAGGPYRDCHGGSRCRGTLVFEWD